MVDYHALIQAHFVHFTNPDATIEDAQAFMHPEMIWREMSNLFVPAGRAHLRAELAVFWGRGKTLPANQIYTLRQVLVTGETAAIQLDWEGAIAQAVGDFNVGQQLKAHIAIFMEFQDGKIIRQTDYPCYYPFK